MKPVTKQTIQFFLKQVSTCRRLAVVLVISISLAVCLSLVSPYFYKLFFDKLASGSPTEAIVSALTKIVITLFLLNLGQQAFWRLASFLNIRLQSSLMKQTCDQCFYYLHKHSYDFFNSNFSGALVKRVNRLVRAVEGFGDRIVWDFIPLIIRLVVIISMLYYTQPVIGLIFLIWAIFFITVNYLFSRYKLKFDVDKASADSKLTACLADTITNHANLKLFASLGRELKDFKKNSQLWLEKTRLAWTLDNVSEAIQAFLMGLLEFCIFYLGVRFWQAGQISIGDFVLIQAYVIELFGQLWNFGRVMRYLYENLADAEEMITVLNTPPAIKNASGAKPLLANRGEIIFQNVSFGYDQNKNFIRNLDLKIKAGAKIAFIGPSGEGKSTLAKLLVRFFDVTAGRILIDQHDIRHCTLRSLAQSISLVPQDPILFHRSLFDNIAYGRPGASQREVESAARLAYCHKFISDLPKGYNTYVGERGVKLSGGQRQRVAIARAILKNSPILILDEATSSLDSHAEKLIQKALINLMKNKTTIVIAHRLSTIAQMDRIVVIKNGQILEQGSHLELLQKSDSLYQKLWNLQVSGYQGSDLLPAKNFSEPFKTILSDAE